MPDWIPKPDGDAVSYSNTVITAIEADEAAYGTTSLVSAALRTLHTAFSTAFTASEASKAATAIAVQAKVDARKALEDSLRPLVRQIQADPDVSDADRTAAGLPIRDTVRTINTPVAPAGLVAVVEAPTTNLLTWDDGGNAPGVQYVIEAKPAGATDYSTADVITARRYRHTGRTPGQAVSYRIRARRGTVLSDPSNVASAGA